MYPLQRMKSQNAVQAQWKKNPRWWKTQEIMILYTYNLINTQKVAIKKQYNKQQLFDSIFVCKVLLMHIKLREQCIQDGGRVD